MIAIDKQSDH